MQKSKRYLTAILLPALLPLACGGGGETGEAPAAEAPPAAASAGKAPDLSQAGTVSGKVSFEGERPRLARIRMSAEPACEAKHSGPTYSQDAQIGDDGGVRDAFVWVRSGLEGYRFETPSDPVVLDQTGCVYAPHVLGVQTGQGILIKNSDPVTHNIHPVPENNREWNISQAPDQEMTRSFPRQEVAISVKCNVHPWMKSYIAVITHPYFAVTGDDGSFELPDLPPGEYTLEVWHEKFGTREQALTLEANGSAEANFTYTGS